MFSIYLVKLVFYQYRYLKTKFHVQYTRVMLFSMCGMSSALTMNSALTVNVAFVYIVHMQMYMCVIYLHQLWIDRQIIYIYVIHYYTQLVRLDFVDYIRSSKASVTFSCTVKCVVYILTDVFCNFIHLLACSISYPKRQHR